MTIGIDTVFQYTTLQSLRDEGLSGTEVSDTRLRQLIRLASNTINTATCQFFIPVKDKFSVRGSGSRTQKTPLSVPIVVLSDFTSIVGNVNVTRTGIDLDSLVIDRRGVEYVSGNDFSRISQWPFSPSLRFFPSAWQFPQR